MLHSLMQDSVPVARIYFRAKFGRGEGKTIFAIKFHSVSFFLIGPEIDVVRCDSNLFYNEISSGCRGGEEFSTIEIEVNRF